MTNTAQHDIDQSPSDRTLEPVDLVAGYFECWNAPDEDRRLRAIRATWAEGATSTDPLATVTGHEPIRQMMAAVFESYAGHSFRQVGAVDAHHNVIRWGWEMLDQNGDKVLDGIDAAWVDESGKIVELAGFFGADVPVEEAN